MFRRFARIRDREPEAPEEVERGPVRREPLPVARAILWTPLPDSYHLLASMMRTPEQQGQLFVTQRAFLQVERHLRSAPELELGGFLAGQLYECPRTHVRYAVVNTVVPFADVSEDAIGSRVTQEAFDTAQERLGRHRLSLIGWYRNGTGLGLQLLPDDVETHMTYFPEPWHATMLVVQTPKKSKGAFFTYDQRASRSYCIPFYELFDTRAVEASRLGRTCVSWSTYVAATPVEPLPVADQEVVEATVGPTRRAPEPEPPEPIEEWWDAIKDPWVRLKDVTVGGTRRDEPLPLVYESPVLPMPTSTPVLTPERDATPRMTPAADMSEAPRATVPEPRVEAQPPRPEPMRAAPPFAGPARPPVRRTAPPPPRAEAASRPVERQTPHEKDASPPLGAAGPKPQPRGSPPIPRSIPLATAAAMARAPEAPAVALPPDFHDEAIRWRRRRRIGFAVATASFLAVILLSTMRVRTSGSVPVARTAPVATSAPAMQLTASDNGHVILNLPVAVDSLSGALSYYREIEADHRGGLVGCRVLDRAYQFVGQARTRLDSARSRVAGSLDDADSIRVSMLRAEFTHVAQTYRRSGCRG